MKKCLILFGLLLHFWMLGADGYYCKHIGVDNGLSQSAITSVVYDGRGALWIGTRFGLNVYRNGKINTFYDDADGRIQGNYINFTFCDSAGTLWTSTDRGLFRYDRSNERFEFVSESQATCALEDENGIWFGSHFGLKYYSFESGTVSGEDTDVYSDYQMLFFFENELYSLDRKLGLVRYAEGGEENVQIKELEDGMIMSAAVDGNMLYLSILGYGLAGFDLSSRETVFSKRKGEDGFPQEPLLALMVLENELWMGFDGAGIWLLDTESGEIDQLGRQPAQLGGHIPLSVTYLYNDPLGNVWVGSVRFGLVGLKRSPIKTFTLTDIDPSAENVIISVLPSRDGNVYLGTDGSGIWRYSPSTGIVPLAGGDGLKVTSIADFDDRHLCLATYNRGFFLMDRESLQLRPFILVDETTNAAECFSSNAPTIYTLPDGKILFLAVDTYIYDPLTRKFRRFTDLSDDDGKELIVIGSTGSGTLYAYSSEGLFTINVEDLTLNLIFKTNQETGSVNAAVYHGGLLWFGTNYGLFSFDPRSSGVQKVETGLFSRVSRLESNGADNLWIAADNTLFLSRNGVVEMTGENRGVPANEILSGAGTPDGTVYLGGTAGLVEIGANCFFGVPENKQLELADASSGHIRVPHNYSSLDISVNLAGADPFERVLYKYIVSGSSEVVEESYEQSISLPALKPGRYRISVSYLKSDGTWSLPQNVAQLRVLKPWYASTLMIIIYIVLGFVLVVIIIDKVSRMKVEALESELRARDMAFTSKVEAFIDEHLADPQLCVSQIAGHMAMSRATLYYRMNSAFGKGVAEVIEEKRMAKAEELLSSSTFSVLDISEKVGYSSSRYFSTRFKLLHSGQTPIKYRQSHR